MAGTSASVQILADKSDEILKAMKEQVEIGLKAVGAAAEGYAKDECPVDSGRLRNSIAWAVAGEHSSGDGRDTPMGEPEEKTVYIGTNVEYAERIETNDKLRHTSGKAHYLRDAMVTHVDHYKRIMEAALKT